MPQFPTWLKATLDSIITDGRVKVDAAIDASDIQIGAVEIKNASSDARAPVDATYGLAVDVKRSVAIALDAGTLAALESNTSTPTASELHLGEVGGNIVAVGTEITRQTGNTSAYIAKDVLANLESGASVAKFADLMRVNGGSGYLTKLRMMTDQKTFVGRIRVHLFHTAPTAINDNSPYLLLYANRANRLGFVDLPAAATEDATNSTAAAAQFTGPAFPIYAAGGSKDIHFVPEFLDGFTPADGQKFYFEATADRN